MDWCVFDVLSFIIFVSLIVMFIIKWEYLVMIYIKIKIKMYVYFCVLYVIMYIVIFCNGGIVVYLYISKNFWYIGFFCVVFMYFELIFN